MDIAVPKSFSDKPYAHEKFQQIVLWAKANHPFYQSWLKNADQQVPLLTRTDVLENNDRILNGHNITATTSGSTGVPVKVSWSKERIKLENEVTNRYVDWLGGRLNVTRIIHLDKPQANTLDVSSKVADQLTLIQNRYKNEEANGITTYPSNAERLCQFVIENQLDMSFIKRFGVYAEVFEPHQESLIEKAFPKAQIWSTYSSQELGIIAARCPHNPEFHHVMAGKLGVEILNEKNLPCTKGEIGRLVITDFFNHNSPLIRYDIGDLAAWGQCPCEQINLPALSAVLGKVRGSLLHRNGERIPFTELSVSLRDIPGMRQYQVIQKNLEHFKVRLVNSRKTLSQELVKEIDAAFQKHFGYIPEIELQMEPFIEREANGKFYSSICKI